jgi:hypothetical protein
MDSTIVALFEDPQRAEDAKRELVARGLIDESNVSLARQSAATMPHGPWERLKARFGSPPPARERGLLTVYVEGDRMRQAERMIRQHGPIDVQTHLSSAIERGAPPERQARSSPLP